MTLNSLAQLLKRLKQEPNWEKYRVYEKLMLVWNESIKPEFKQYSHPVYLSRSILWVAVANSVWAQHLSLQRYELLKKFNSHLDEPLKDIRFSTAHWQQKFSQLTVVDIESTVRHPSQTPNEYLEVPLAESSTVGNTPQEALQRWLKTVELRSQNLPSCPQCNCPTPPGELARWGVCCCCYGRFSGST